MKEIMVEVAYALPDQQLIIPLSVHAGCTALEAVQRSGILNKFPDSDVHKNQMGIFGKLIKHETGLRHLDRVEIYRPLIADPKEARRQRAADGGATK